MADMIDQVAGAPDRDDEGEIVLEDVIAETFDPSREAWKIEHLGQADWAMARLADIQARARHYDDQIMLWEAAKKRIERGMDWLQARLAEWGIAQRAAAPKVKTFPLAHGTVATRGGKPKIVVIDEDAVIDWALVSDNDDAVKVVKRWLVSNSCVRIVDGVAVDPQGQPVPGLSVQDAEVTVTVTPLGV